MNEPRLIDATALLNYISNLQRCDFAEDYFELYEMMKDIVKKFPTYQKTEEVK